MIKTEVLHLWPKLVNTTNVILPDLNSNYQSLQGRQLSRPRSCKMKARRLTYCSIENDSSEEGLSYSTFLSVSIRHVN